MPLPPIRFRALSAFTYLELPNAIAHDHRFLSCDDDGDDDYDDDDYDYNSDDDDDYHDDDDNDDEDDDDDDHCGGDDCFWLTFIKVSHAVVHNMVPSG